MDALRVIDPRLSTDLIDLLEAHEVPNEEGALLWEIEKRGYWLYLSGPDEDRPVDSRFEVRVGTVAEDDRRKITRGPTAKIALARAFAHIVESGL